jgi:hypothetical protein
LAHLYKLRVGWEGERLAHYLLSRFSFVAQPTTVADDLGSDFFCTIFDIVDSRPPTVEPRGSFAIQVKSAHDPIDAHNKVGYLQHLEIPFFIGVVSQSPAQMDVYTAERLPVLFARFGIPEKLWLCPVAREDYDPKNYCHGENAASGVRLDCPYVSTFAATEDRDSLQSKVDQLNAICRRASSNIATRRTEEHIYDMGEGQLNIVAGCGSVQHFRNNFCKRLAEVFYNLEWLFKNQRDEFNIDEFKVYESLYQSLGKLPLAPALSAVSHVYKQLKDSLDQAIADGGISAKR